MGAREGALSARLRAVLTHAGLGLWLGAGSCVVAVALAPAALRAQVSPRDTTRRDSVRVRRDTAVVPIPQRPDSTIVADTSRAARQRADSIKAPFGQAESPVATDIGLRYAWDREAFFASGAITLLDLLERVPGLTGFRAGWVAAPMTASYLGVPGRIRVFVDGVELDALQPREGGMLDLAAIQLWDLEDVVVERGASEVRVWVRGWRHQRTTPYTRIDVSTGDEETNSYRAFYGKRFTNGMGLQVGAQQYSTNASALTGGSGDALSLVARVGWARGRWSLDTYLQQNRRSMDALQNGTRSGSGETMLSTVETRDRLAYVRAAYGQPDRDGLWAHLLASTRRVSESGDRVDSAAAAGSGFPVDTVDTLVSRPQYVAAAGVTRGGVRLSGTVRLRAAGGTTLVSPMARLSIDRRWLSASLVGERLEPVADSAFTRLEALARVSPTSFLSFGGAVTQERDREGPPGQGENRNTEALAARAEAAVRLGRTWFSGGVLARDAAYLRQPQLFYPAPVGPRVADGDALGSFAAIRGSLWKGFGIDAHGVRWNESDTYYRPQWQSRSELYFRTNLLRKFPSGEFGFLAAAIHEYRSNVLFPAADGDTRTAPQSHVLGTLVELRLQRAVISWQYRNVTGTRYEYVPGFSAPRPINFYGVRWEFWN